MKTFAFASALLALASACVFAQPIQISQASIAASSNDGTRATNGFPYMITQPGSYQLSGNITVPANVNGIVIASSNVTLDLNGFTITCLGPETTIVFGISLPPQGVFNAITVRNGGIVGPNSVFFAGMALGNGASSGMTVQDMTVTTGGNGGQIGVDPNSIVRHNIVNGPIHVACPSIITENISLHFDVSGNGPANCVLWNNRGSNFTAPVSQ